MLKWNAGLFTDVTRLTVSVCMVQMLYNLRTVRINKTIFAVPL